MEHVLHTEHHSKYYKYNEKVEKSLVFQRQQKKLHYICEIYVLLYYLMHKSMKY